jgi:hypothetical protein
MHKYTKVGLKNCLPPVQNIPTFSVLDVTGPVPIHPVENYWKTPDLQYNFINHSRKMLPHTTAWAFTIWKAQGQTFLEQVVLHLGKDEKEHWLMRMLLFLVRYDLPTLV